MGRLERVKAPLARVTVLTEVVPAVAVMVAPLRGPDVPDTVPDMEPFPGVRVMTMPLRVSPPDRSISWVAVAYPCLVTTSR